MILGLVVVALLGFVLAFAGHSPGLVGFGFIVGLACAIAAALIFIGQHVRASSRPEHMTDRELAALRGTMQQDAKTSERLPPPAP